jgi:hypothetical protein
MLTMLRSSELFLQYPNQVLKNTDVINVNPH